MIQKAVSMLYKILCVAVWAGTMGFIALITVLLCTGEKQSPEFHLNSLTISQGANYDEVLCSRTADPAGWYKAEYNITVTGGKMSPYTYTASSAVYNSTQQDKKNGTEIFVAPVGNLTYSKLSPATFTLTMYIKCDDIQEAKSIALRANLGLRDVKQHFAFFYKDLKMNLPGFSVSDYQIEPVVV